LLSNVITILIGGIMKKTQIIPENPRKNWELFAEKMSKQKDDSLLDESVLNHSWNEDDWEW
jgi:hypothetical protein